MISKISPYTGVLRERLEFVAPLGLSLDKVHPAFIARGIRPKRGRRS
jgi:hypothetical protein